MPRAFLLHRCGKNSVFDAISEKPIESDYFSNDQEGCVMISDKHHTRIGAFVLETLTTGMYRNPLDTLREYVQNAFDSIRAAERESVIGTGTGRIHVAISEKDRTLSIRDNGTGVPAADVAATLKDIGTSAKSVENDVGFRGIGRLAGIAYCDRLVFKTQHYEKMTISTVTFDAVALRDAMSPKNREVKELGEVVDEYVTVTTEPAKRKESFLEVSMIGINPNGKIFLDMTAVSTYLEQVAPLPLDRQSVSLSKRFYDWVRGTRVDLREVNIVLEMGGNSRELFKPLKKRTYYTKQDKHEVLVEDLCFFPENATNDSPFWIWYADTNCPGTIDDDSVAGFRFRKANIAIGPSGDRMTEIFRLVATSNARFNRYFIGEVHIQDPAVIPNAHRDDFEETPEWLAIREQLIAFARERSNDVRFLSDWRNASIGKIMTTTGKSLDEVEKKRNSGFSSKSEQAKLDENIGKDISKVEAALQKADRPEDEKKRIENRLKELKTAREEIVEIKIGGRPRSSLDRKQRKILSEIRELLYEKLDKRCYETANAAIVEKYQLFEKE
uniref:Molecular chaperone HtpG n=1 Tax=Candidatus Kentrum sp. FM TaxID=2126340 RepID=A0A450W0B2_9GAMM|nr:MAG: molecular chaperone HtpG [Candidatus Kentron sp. FM]VFJ56114.1 MAG: molecular chaperone HtpG [Candidatus Kentron sp. FM]VFK10470.1 MAG: molecular chaperone HtpG [Candidatus Kentron sp. FM]